MSEIQPKAARFNRPLTASPETDPITVSNIPVLVKKMVTTSAGVMQLNLEVTADEAKVGELIQAILPVHDRTIMISVISADTQG